MKFVEQDFAYYERTIKRMYQSYYWKRILILAFVLVIVLAYTGIFQEHFLYNVLLMIIIAGGRYLSLSAKTKISRGLSKISRDKSTRSKNR